MPTAHTRAGFMAPITRMGAIRTATAIDAGRWTPDCGGCGGRSTVGRLTTKKSDDKENWPKHKASAEFEQGGFTSRRRVAYVTPAFACGSVIASCLATNTR